MSFFVHAKGIKTFDAGPKMAQNSVHVVVERPHRAIIHCNLLTQDTNMSQVIQSIVHKIGPILIVF